MSSSVLVANEFFVVKSINHSSINARSHYYLHVWDADDSGSGGSPGVVPTPGVAARVGEHVLQHGRD
jgi:hypothetical protein